MSDELPDPIDESVLNVPFSGSAGMSEPRTAPGRVMADRLKDAPGYGPTPWVERILAIEEQAAAEARRELLAKVEGLPHDGAFNISRGAVIDAIRLLDPSR